MWKKHKRLTCCLSSLLVASMFACVLGPQPRTEKAKPELASTAEVEGSDFLFPEIPTPAPPHAVEPSGEATVVEFDPATFDEGLSTYPAIARLMERHPNYRSVGWRVDQAYDNGSKAHMFPITDGEQSRQILYLVGPEEESRWQTMAFMVTLIDEGLVLYDGDGAMLITDSEIQILDAERSSLWSTREESCRTNGLATAAGFQGVSFVPRAMMSRAEPRGCSDTYWDEFGKCIGWYGQAVGTGMLCAAAMTTAAYKCGAAVLSGGAMSPLCAAAVLVLIGRCGVMTGTCLWRAQDDPPEIFIGPWRPTGRTQELLWPGDGTITAEVMCAKIHYRDDRMPCCETVPASGEICAPRGAAPVNAAVIDCGKHRSEQSVGVPDPTPQELATFRRTSHDPPEAEGPEWWIVEGSCQFIAEDMWRMFTLANTCWDQNNDAQSCTGTTRWSLSVGRGGFVIDGHNTSDCCGAEEYERYTIDGRVEGRILLGTGDLDYEYEERQGVTPQWFTGLVLGNELMGHFCVMEPGVQAAIDQWLEDMRGGADYYPPCSTMNAITCEVEHP